MIYAGAHNRHEGHTELLAVSGVLMFNSPCVVAAAWAFQSIGASKDLMMNNEDGVATGGEMMATDHQHNARVAAIAEKHRAGSGAPRTQPTAPAAIQPMSGMLATASATPPASPDDANGGMLLVGGKAGLYSCDYCMRDVSTTLRFRCAECTDWDLCADCFCTGVELKQHKKTHTYRVVDNTNFPIFTPDWSATEELLLLSALETAGMGNWGKAAEMLGSKDKSEKACMEHYLDTYCYAYGSVLPRYTFTSAGRVETARLVQDPEVLKMKPVTLDNYPEADHLRNAPVTPPDGTPFIRERFKSKAVTEKDRLAVPTDVIPGYMPLRGDFDVEHENDAEHLLADMEINPEDDPAEKELKLMVIEVFNRKLDEREKRKQFVKDYGLIDYKAMQNRERRKPKDERELLAKMRIFARFQRPDQHEQFVQSILEAKRLRKRIEQLQHYRRLGIRTQAEANQYEAEKKRRELDQQMRKQREGAAYLYDSAKPSNTTKDRLNRYKKRHRDSDGELAELDTGGKTAASRSGPGALDVDELPGAEMLSAKEKDLCATLRIMPKHYMFIKERLLQESMKRGFLDDEPDTRQLVSMDVTKTDKVVEFLVQCGWVQASSARLQRPVKDVHIRVKDNTSAQPSTENTAAAAAAGGGRGAGADAAASGVKDEEQDAGLSSAMDLVVIDDDEVHTAQAGEAAGSAQNVVGEGSQVLEQASAAAAGPAAPPSEVVVLDGDDDGDDDDDHAGNDESDAAALDGEGEAEPPSAAAEEEADADGEEYMEM